MNYSVSFHLRARFALTGEAIFYLWCSAAHAQCNCTVPTSSLGLPAGKTIRATIDQSIPQGTVLAQAVTNSISDWQAIEQKYPNDLLQLSQTGSSTNTLTFRIDSRKNWTSKGAKDTDNFYYYQFTASDGHVEATVVFFSEGTPLGLSADVARNRTNHEIGHGHHLDDITDTTANCGQAQSVMVYDPDLGQPFVINPSECDESTTDQAYGVPPPAPPPPDTCQPPNNCSRWDSVNCICLDEPIVDGSVCPILLAVGGSSAYQLVGPNEGVWFDLTADGRPDRLAWTQAGDSVGFLALDRNHNGVIDNGRELFGNYTPLEGDQTAVNGFQALAAWDHAGVGGNENGWIDPGDAVWPDLSVWIDFNHDGVSQPEELFSLAQFGISRISTTALQEMRKDRFGNLFRLRGEFVINNQPRPAYDVYFAVIEP